MSSDIYLDEKQNYSAHLSDDGSLKIIPSNSEETTLNLNASQAWVLLKMLYDHGDILYDRAQLEGEPRPQWLYKHEA